MNFDSDVSPSYRRYYGEGDLHEMIFFVMQQDVNLPVDIAMIQSQEGVVYFIPWRLLNNVGSPINDSH